MVSKPKRKPASATVKVQRKTLLFLIECVCSNLTKRDRIAERKNGRTANGGTIAQTQVVVECMRRAEMIGCVQGV